MTRTRTLLSSAVFVIAVIVAWRMTLFPQMSVAANTLPSSVNLAIPFTIQAPNANWDKTHEDFCEEASVLMAVRFVQHKTIKNAADAETSLQAIKTWELKNLGFFESTTAAQTASIVQGEFGLHVQLVRNPTVAQLKAFLAAGKPVIVPAAGRLLNNPNFKRPGPLYHNLVLKGYTKSGRFIANDPGTRKGANYQYSAATLMNAMHDWNGGDVTHGAKVVLVVSAS